MKLSVVAVSEYFQYWPGSVLRGLPQLGTFCDVLCRVSPVTVLIKSKTWYIMKFHPLFWSIISLDSLTTSLFQLAFVFILCDAIMSCC